MLRTGLTNLFLRGVTLAGKFVLLMAMARVLTPEEVGVFGLMSVSIGIAVLVLGLDFYVFNTREILAVNNEGIEPLVRDQLVFHGIIYVVVLPLMLMVFLTGMLPWKYAGWFYLLLIFEHLGQEAFRLLTTLSRPLAATTVLFLRTGLWAYLAVAALFWAQSLRHLSFIWGLWAAGSLSGILLGSALLLRHRKRPRAIPVNWRWIGKGVRVCLPFFGATLALMGVQYADRYALMFFRGEAAVGVYTFFAGIANVIQVFVFSGVVMILYPRIVASYQQGDMAAYSSLMRKLTAGVMGGATVIGVVLSLSIRPLLKMIGKEAYSMHLSVFWILLAAVTLLAVSFIPHFGLYARGKDRAIILSTGIAFIVAIAGNLLLVPRWGVYGAAAATCAAMLALSVAKAISLRSVPDTPLESVAMAAGLSNSVCVGEQHESVV